MVFTALSLRADAETDTGRTIAIAGISAIGGAMIGSAMSSNCHSRHVHHYHEPVPVVVHRRVVTSSCNRMVHLEAEIDELIDENAQLRKENRELREFLDELRSTQSALKHLEKRCERLAGQNEILQKKLNAAERIK